MLRQKAVLFQTVEIHTHVIWPLACHVKQEALQVDKLSVVWIISPRRDLDAVARLAHKILSNVVNDDDFGEVAPNEGQVLYVVSRLVRGLVFHLDGVLTVQSVRDGLGLIQRIQDLVRILQHRHTNT